MEYTKSAPLFLKMINTHFFLSYIEQFSYFGIFILLALSGYIIPIPEEILLLLIGYAAGVGLNNIYITLIPAMLGVLAGDNILFWLSRYRGSKIIDRLKHKVRKHELAKYRHLMKKHIGKTIFIVRFIVGLRFFGPFLAGSMKIKWKTYQFYNLLAVFIYVPLLIFLGFHFHAQLALIITEVEIIRHLIFFAFLAVLVYLISIFLNKNYLIKEKSK